MKTFRLVLVLAFLSACSSCKTGGTSDGGGIVNGIVHCAEQATHVAALNILDDVSSALVSGNWQAALANLVGRWGESAVACAVQEVAGNAAHLYQASGDGLERLKAERGRAYLETHPVGP